MREVALCEVSISFERKTSPNIVSQKFTKYSTWLEIQIKVAKWD